MLSTYSSYARESAGDSDDTSGAVAPQGFNTVGVQMSGNQARLLFGVSPLEPRVTIPLSRVALSGDIADLVGYLTTTGATITTLQSGTVDTNYLNSTNSYLTTIQNQSIDTEAITTGGQPLVCDWYANGTDLPTIQLINNPLKTGYNSDKTKGNFSIGDLLISAGEAAATDALLYLAKAGGGWLLNAAQGAFSLFNGYASLSEAGLSLGADAAGAGAALGGDFAAFTAGESGLVLASSASEAASLFSSAGVLAEGGLAFSSELGEVGQGLLSGIESSTAELEGIVDSPDFINTLLGTAKWVSI